MSKDVLWVAVGVIWWLNTAMFLGKGYWLLALASGCVVIWCGYNVSKREE